MERKSKILAVAVIILALLTGTEAIFYIQLQNSYKHLSIIHNDLNASYVDLQSQHRNLTESYASLQHNYQEKIRDYAKLQKEYTGLETSYDYLERRHDSLKQSYSQLQTDYEIEKALCIGNSLESYYDLLRDELGPTGAKGWWLIFTKSSWQTKVDFAANLALHDLRRIYWPRIEDEYYEDVGEYSYDTAKAKIDEITRLVNIGYYDSETVRIEKVLEFVYEHIHYEAEVNDVFLAPVETIGYKSGDCDDFTILVAALFESVNIDSAIGFFRNDNQYHAMVLVHMETLTGYGYYYFSDLTHRDLEEGRWIIIEPQSLIENQDSDWIEQWELLVVAPIDY